MVKFVGGVYGLKLMKTTEGSSYSLTVHRSMSLNIQSYYGVKFIRLFCIQLYISIWSGSGLVPSLRPYSGIHVYIGYMGGRLVYSILSP